MPRPGDVLGEKYTLLHMLGAGGMGVVFEAEHAVTRRHFAIKWLRTDAEDKRQSVRRFMREAQIVGRIQHPNVVQIIDIHQENGSLFQVMELLDGESLASRLQRTGALPVPAACQIMIDSMSGVIAAHKTGVVHRDIKPANIFLCAATDSTPAVTKVLDFGISRFIDPPSFAAESETRTGTLLGTPQYMAPEQMRAGDADQRADIYALGVTLYELLSGVRPYTGATFAELVLNVSQGNAARLDVIAPHVPKLLSKVVAQAMHHNAAERFESVERFQDALRPFVSLSAEPVVRPRRRRWLLLAAALPLAAAGSAWWLWTTPVDQVSPATAAPEEEARRQNTLPQQAETGPQPGAATETAPQQAGEAAAQPPLPAAPVSAPTPAQPGTPRARTHGPTRSATTTRDPSANNRNAPSPEKHKPKPTQSAEPSASERPSAELPSQRPTRPALRVKSQDFLVDSPAEPSPP